MPPTMVPQADPSSRTELKSIRRIFHPSDFTPASESAFRHGLKLAQLAQAELTILHVAQNDQSNWGDFPGVREWLERWRLIPRGSGRDAIKALGLQVQKILVHSNDTTRACLHYLDRHPAELIVLATRQRETRAVWPHPEARGSQTSTGSLMTLFVPDAENGFVYASDGAVQMRRVLIPIAAQPDPQLAVNAAARLAHTLGVAVVEFTLLHIGSEGSVPEVRTPVRPGWTWRYAVRQGEVAPEILAAIHEGTPDLVAMSTDGLHGYLDALRGNITECILNRSRCPLLAVPAHSPA